MTEMAFARLSFEAPLILAYLVGLFLAMTRRHRHPRSCRFMGIGTALLLAVALFDVFQMHVHAVVHELWLAFDAGWREGDVHYAMAVVSYLVQPIAVGLLFTAVLVGRGQPQKN